MAAIPRTRAEITSLIDQPCGTRLALNTVGAERSKSKTRRRSPLHPPTHTQFVGVLAGAGAALVSITLKTPAQGQAGAAFRNALLEVGPMSAGMAATFTLVSCIAKDARSKDDWVNPFLGGGVAGAVAVFVKRRSIPAMLGGSIVLGAAAASPFWFTAMSPTVEELQAKRLNMKSTLAGAETFAGPSQSAAGVQRRLL